MLTSAIPTGAPLVETVYYRSLTPGERKLVIRLRYSNATGTALHQETAQVAVLAPFDLTFEHLPLHGHTADPSTAVILASEPFLLCVEGRSNAPRHALEVLKAEIIAVRTFR